MNHPTTPRSRARRAVTALTVLLAVSLVSTGCISSPSRAAGGQTPAQAEATLLSIPGVSYANVDNDGSRSGFFTTYFTTYVAVEIDPGYTVDDGQALADYLVRTAWSIDDGHRPDDSLAITVYVHPPDDFNIGDYAAEWDGYTGEPRQDDEGFRRTGFGIDTARDSGAEVEELLGPWPGQAPSLPENVIVPR